MEDAAEQEQSICVGLLDDFRTFLSSPDVIAGSPETTGDAYRKVEQMPSGHLPASARRLPTKPTAPPKELTETVIDPGLATSDPPALTVPASLMSRYDRNQLYEKIWSDSLKQAAMDHRVSESTLKRACVELHIPLPGRGYWKSKLWGKAVEQWPPLPDVQTVPTVHRKYVKSATQPFVVSGRLMERYNRAELYEDVWRLPMSELAAKWGVTQSTLCQICKRLYIPVPGKGYWSKSERNRTLQPPPLPPIQVDPKFVTRKRLSALDQELGQITTSALATTEPQSPPSGYTVGEIDRPHLDADESAMVEALNSEETMPSGETVSLNFSALTVAEFDHNSSNESVSPDNDVALFHLNDDSAGQFREEDNGAGAGEVSPVSESPAGDTVANNANGNRLPELEDSEGPLFVLASLASRYDRQKLYDRVWSVPMWTLCKEYGVSDVALAKTCRRLHVPVPGRGYWAMLAAGKPTQPRPPLPSIEVVERLAPKRKNHHHSPDEAVALIKHIRAAVEVGKSVREACREANISESTYRQWLLSFGAI